MMQCTLGWQVHHDLPPDGQELQLHLISEELQSREELSVASGAAVGTWSLAQFLSVWLDWTIAA